VVIGLTLRAQWRLGLTSNMESIGTLLFVYLASISAAYALRVFVELPSIRLSHRLKQV
jgi:hypothetical protein